MNYHVTLELDSYEDYFLLLRLIKSGGFELLYADEHTFTLNCYLDDTLLSLTKKYMGDVIRFNQEESPQVRELIAAFPALRVPAKLQRNSLGQAG